MDYLTKLGLPEGINWEAVYDRMEYIVNSLPDDLENESIKLMNRGWFIWFLDGTLPDLSEKMEALVGRTDKKQDDYLRAYVKRNIPYFKAELCSKYASRKNQIEDAFESHHLGLYYASIPTLLALSEGVGRDLYPKIGVFSKHSRDNAKAGLPKTDDIFDSISGLEVFEVAVLKPLRVTSELTKSIHQPRENDKKLLNRHLIMHGNTSSYGSEENSLKAISLVFFIHRALEHLKSTANT